MPTWYYAGMVRLRNALLVLALTFVIIFSGVLHNSVHHEHSHSATDTTFWGQLHSALRHDEKDLVAVPTLSVLALLVISSLLLTQLFIRLPRSVAFLHPDRGSYLRRGLARYRCFG
jgi:hypothetical protein